MRKVFLCFTVVTMSLAQQAPAPVQSPDVQTDGRVTFRFRAPNAQHVAVNVEGAKAPLAMQKDEVGIWTATTEPLAPELYGYSFNVDGVQLIDPSNSAIKPNLLAVASEVQVPGPSPMPWEPADIAHGVIHHHFYKSGVVGDNRDFYVYTPPGYDANPSTRYPVLYLLHGYSDDASGWSAVGKANLILDSLIDSGKAKPMIVVMPLGYGAPEFVQKTPVSRDPFRSADLREKNFTRFRAALIEEVIPQVERNYRAFTDRDSRAIAGLSMGGAESLLTGLNRLDRFSAVGAFSAGGLSDDFAADFPQLNGAANAQLHLLWIACGTDDRLINLNRNLVSWLKGKGLRLTLVETPGMHTWMVWRANLIAFAPLLFRDHTVRALPTPITEK